MTEGTNDGDGAPPDIATGEDGRPVIVAAWLREPHLQRLLRHLLDGEEGTDGEPSVPYVVGGAVRNALLGVPVRDVDLATARRPEATSRIAEALGYKVVPTGIEHGTVTVVTPAGPYEVTTFRTDEETDGRHARVAFTNDLRQDAERRDFTINALYAAADGVIVDVVDGLTDIRTRTVRFIGDADERIREDYLRILRFFRFHAHYGRGRPDAEGLRACARNKAGIARLSPERVWSELRRLLEAPEPGMTMLWMRTTGVLATVLPEGERWGIDALPGLVAVERDLGWAPDPMLRLAAILPPDAERMEALADRLRMSNAERERLAAWARATPPVASLSESKLRERLYREGRSGIEDRLRLALASVRGRAASEDGALEDAADLSRLLDVAETWQRPEFPLKGRDLVELGIPAGPEIGERLNALEEAWIASGFEGDRDAMIASALSGMSGET